jgi:hypothetical protein
MRKISTSSKVEQHSFSRKNDVLQKLLGKILEARRV